MTERSIPQRRRRLRLRDLETLVAIERAGAMRKAAADLHLSQPAVSKAVRELEDALGVRLFERGPQGTEATAHGHALLRRAKTVIDELHSALLELDWLSDPDVGEVSVGGGDTQQVGLLAAVAQTLLERRPRMRIVFESAQSHGLLGHLLPQRMVDLAVIRPSIHPLPAEIEAEPLYHEQLHVVAGPGHRLAGRRRIALSELVDERWILSRNELMADSPVLQAFAAAGLPPPARVVESGTVALRQSLLAGGRFVTCVPHTILAFARRQAGLRVLPVPLPRWSTPTMILKLRGRTLSPAADLFMETLRETARSFRLD